jgi:hypothetical protein
MRLQLIALLLFVLTAACGGDETGSSPESGGGGAPATTATTASTGSGGAGGASAGGASAVGGSGGVGGAGGVPLAGFGAIMGSCGELDPPELVAMTMPQKLDNNIDFAMMPFDEVADYAALSTGGKKVLDDGNLGGSSLYSEIFSYEVLYRCELATLLKTEGEIVYDNPNGTKTDLLVVIDGAKIGVSVTRGYHFPPNTPYTVAQAQTLLENKLGDILVSSANVSTGDAWQKQILHILAYEMQHVTALQTAYGLLDPAVLADTIVIVTLTEGDDAFIYN